MYIKVADGSARVCDGDDCTSLDVRVASRQRGTVDLALRGSGLGRCDGTAAEAEVDLAVLRSAAAGDAVASDWPQRWERMVAYAAQRGWLTADARRVRAHLVDECADITGTGLPG